jgi:hypothetical protein
MPSAHAELRVIRWVRGRPVGGHAMRRWASVLTRAMRSPFVAADRLLAFSRRLATRIPTPDAPPACPPAGAIQWHGSGRG